MRRPPFPNRVASTVGKWKWKYGGASPGGIARSGSPAFPYRSPPFPNRVPSTVGGGKIEYGEASPGGATRSGSPAFPYRSPPFPNRVPSTVGKYVTRISFRAYQEALDFPTRPLLLPHG